MTDLRRTALVVGAAAGITGDGLFLTALAWSVLEVTGSPQRLSLVLVVLTVVPLVTAPLAGQLVDRPRGPDYVAGSECLAALVLVGAAGWLSVSSPGLPFFLLVAAVVPAFASLSGPALWIMLARLSDAGRVTGSLARAELATRTGRVIGPAQPEVADRDQGAAELIGISGALRPAGTLTGGVVAGVLGAAAATGMGAAGLALIGGWYALRDPGRVA